MWLTSASWCLWACQSAVFPCCWWLQHLAQELWRVWCHYAEFAPTSRCDPAKELMLRDCTLCGWPRPAWPCKPKLSDLMAEGKTLCLLNLLGVSAPWYFDGWCESCSPTQQYCWGWGVGGLETQPWCFHSSTSGPWGGVGQKYSRWFRQS